MIFKESLPDFVSGDKRNPNDLHNVNNWAWRRLNTSYTPIGYKYLWAIMFFDVEIRRETFARYAGAFGQSGLSVEKWKTDVFYLAKTGTLYPTFSQALFEAVKIVSDKMSSDIATAANAMMLQKQCGAVMTVTTTKPNSSVEKK